MMAVLLSLLAYILRGQWARRRRRKKRNWNKKRGEKMVDIYNLGCSRYRVEITETPAVGPPDDDVQMSPTWILSLPVLIGLGSLFFFSLSLSLSFSRLFVSSYVGRFLAFPPRRLGKKKRVLISSSQTLKRISPLGGRSLLRLVFFFFYFRPIPSSILQQPYIYLISLAFRPAQHQSPASALKILSEFGAYGLCLSLPHKGKRERERDNLFRVFYLESLFFCCRLEKELERRSQGIKQSRQDSNPARDAESLNRFCCVC